MQALKLVGLNSNLKISSSVREERLPLCELHPFTPCFPPFELRRELQDCLPLSVRKKLVTPEGRKKGGMIRGGALRFHGRCDFWAMKTSVNGVGRLLSSEGVSWLQGCRGRKTSCHHCIGNTWSDWGVESAPIINFEDSIQPFKQMFIDHLLSSKSPFKMLDRQ